MRDETTLIENCTLKVNPSSGEISNHPSIEKSCQSISDSISSSSTEISVYLSQISNKLNALEPTISEQIMHVVAPAFFGALSAFIFSYIHWKNVEKKNNTVSKVLALKTIIESLEAIAIEYWLTASDADNRPSLKTKELSIKSKINLMIKYCGILEDQLCKSNNKHVKTKLGQFKNEIFDLITGDDFESSSKIASETKASDISHICSEILALLAHIDTSSC